MIYIYFLFISFYSYLIKGTLPAWNNLALNNKEKININIINNQITGPLPEGWNSQTMSYPGVDSSITSKILSYYFIFILSIFVAS